MLPTWSWWMWQSPSSGSDGVVSILSSVCLRANIDHTQESVIGMARNTHPQNTVRLKANNGRSTKNAKNIIVMRIRESQKLASGDAVAHESLKYSSSHSLSMSGLIQAAYIAYRAPAAATRVKSHPMRSCIVINYFKLLAISITGVAATCIRLLPQLLAIS